LEKREGGHIQTLPKVFKYPLLSQELQILYALSYDRSQQNPIILTISGKVAVGVASYARNFSGQPYIGRIMHHLCDSSSFLFRVLSSYFSIEMVQPP